jgi:hypothetical protein
MTGGIISPSSNENLELYGKPFSRDLLVINDLHVIDKLCCWARYQLDLLFSG